MPDLELYYKLTRLPIIDRPKGFFLRWYYNGWHHWQFIAGGQEVITEGKAYNTRSQRSVTIYSGQVSKEQITAIRTILNTRECYIYTDAGWRLSLVTGGDVVVDRSNVNGYELTATVSIGNRMPSVTGFSPVVEIPEVPADDFCQVIIGSQIWMCKNWDANYPGSRAYDDDEDNVAIYGRLYTGNMVTAPGFAPPGWRVPTEDDWDILIDYIGGSLVAGGILKATGLTYWDSPNTGATDGHNFDGRGGGWLNHTTGLFVGKNQFCPMWTKTMDGIQLRFAQLTYNTAAIAKGSFSRNSMFGVRLIKDIPPGGFGDWFLPSLNELTLMYTELHLQGVGGFRDGAGEGYWTSSEFAPNAYAMEFIDGGVWAFAKSNTGAFTRAVRAFTTATPYSLRDVGPAGGRIFWKSGNNYLEAAPGDQDTSIWSNVAATVGGTGSAVGTGASNTAAIIAQAGHTESAAKVCNDLMIWP